MSVFVLNHITGQTVSVEELHDFYYERGTTLSPALLNRELPLKERLRIMLEFTLEYVEPVNTIDELDEWTLDSIRETVENCRTAGDLNSHMESYMFDLDTPDFLLEELVRDGLYNSADCNRLLQRFNNMIGEYLNE